MFVLYKIILYSVMLLSTILSTINIYNVATYKSQSSYGTNIISFPWDCSEIITGYGGGGGGEGGWGERFA